MGMCLTPYKHNFPDVGYNANLIVVGQTVRAFAWRTTGKTGTLASRLSRSLEFIRTVQIDPLPMTFY